MPSRNLEVNFIGDTSDLERELRKVKSQLASVQRSSSTAGAATSKAGTAALGAAKNWARFTAAAVGVGGATVAVQKFVTSTMGFDKAMRNVNSIAHVSEKQFATLEKSVLKLAGKTAQAPQTLAEGLYDLVSSGFKAKEAIGVLAASAKAATAGLTDTATSTKAIAAVINAYHLQASDAAKISDVLFQTVNRGVVTFEELSNSIGDVLPFAATLGVSINQVGAAMATMTKEGINSFEASTRLKNALQAFIKPSKEMAAAIKATGVESGSALVKSRGFQGALEAVIRTTDGSKEAISNLFPNIRGLGGALALTGKNARSAHADLNAFGKGVRGATDRALAEQAKSLSYQWNKLKASIDAAAITIGLKLIPFVNKAIQDWNKGTGAMGRFRAAAEDIGNAVRNLGPVFSVLGRALSLAFNAFSLQVRVIAKVESALVSLYKLIADKILWALQHMVSAIGDVLGIARHLPVVGGTMGKLADSADDAAGSIRRVRDNLRGVKSKTITVTVKGNALSFDPKKFSAPATPNTPPGKLPGLVKPKKVPKKIRDAAHASSLTASPIARAAGEAGGAELGSLQSARAWIQRNYPGANAFIEAGGTGNQHLHVTDPADVVAIGKALQRMGYSIGEYGGPAVPGFGGVTTNRHKHYPGDHYSGGSIDINADYRSLQAAGEVAARTVTRKVAKAVKQAAEKVPVFNVPTLSMGTLGDILASKEARREARRRKRANQIGLGTTTQGFLGQALDYWDALAAAGRISDAEAVTRKVAALQQALPGLSGMSRLQAEAQIRSLTPEGPAPRDAIERAVANIGLHQRAGDISPTQALQQGADFIRAHLGDAGLSEQDVLELRAELGDLTSQLKDLNDNLPQLLQEQIDLVKRQLEDSRRATATASTTAAAALAWIREYVSKQQGMRVAARGHGPSRGVVRVP